MTGGRGFILSIVTVPWVFLPGHTEIALMCLVAEPLGLSRNLIVSQYSPSPSLRGWEEGKEGRAPLDEPFQAHLFAPCKTKGRDAFVAG